MKYGESLTLYNYLIKPWTLGDQFAFNRAAWFVLSLFLVQAVYAGLFLSLRKIPVFRDRLLLILLISLNFATVFYCDNHSETLSGFQYTFGKLFFLLPFYHFGVLFKKHERKIKFRPIIFLSVIFTAQFFLWCTYKGQGMGVWECAFRLGNPFAPLLISLPGICFWLCIAKLLRPAYENSKIVCYIGKNTSTIMTHHPIAFFACNCIILCFSKLFSLGSFDTEAFKTNIWYTYLPDGNFRFALIYVVIAIAIPLLIKYSVEQTTIWISRHIKQSS